MMSKLGFCSRAQAAQWVRQGRVCVNERVVRDPEFPVRPSADRIRLDDGAESRERRTIMLNKPRGLVTTARDEHGRDTVYRCLQGTGLPWLAPVGRLDKASEGLLLFSNDPKWAAGLTAPQSGLDKVYHVQIDRHCDAGLLQTLVSGAHVEDERLAAKEARCIRHGQKTSWLEIVLNEGRNRHIRRLLGAFDIAVMRLVRVAIGPLRLGDLAKGRWRELTAEEIAALQPHASTQTGAATHTGAATTRGAKG